MANFFDILTRKQPKPRGFNYKPIYHNPEKEAFNERIDKLRRERDQIAKGEYRPNFKGKFTSQIGKKTPFQKQMAGYNIRLILVLIIICFAAYYLFTSTKINDGINHFFNTFDQKNGLY